MTGSQLLIPLLTSLQADKYLTRFQKQSKEKRAVVRDIMAEKTESAGKDVMDAILEKVDKTLRLVEAGTDLGVVTSLRVDRLDRYIHAMYHMGWVDCGMRRRVNEVASAENRDLKVMTKPYIFVPELFMWPRKVTFNDAYIPDDEKDDIREQEDQ